jgi:hypothetical protein
LSNSLNNFGAIANTLLEGIKGAASGNVAMVAQKVEQSLGHLGKTLLGILVNIIGFKVANNAKVQGFVKKMKDKIANVGEKLFGPVMNKITGKDDGKNDDKGDPKDIAAKQAIVDKAALEAKTLVDQADDAQDLDLIAGVEAIKAKHKLTQAEIREEGDLFGVYLKLNPDKTTAKKKSRLKAAINEAEAEMRKPDATVSSVKTALPGIKAAHRIQTLELEKLQIWRV